jgi:hypothetical protein
MSTINLATRLHNELSLIQCACGMECACYMTLVAAEKLLQKANTNSKQNAFPFVVGCESSLATH